MKTPKILTLFSYAFIVIFTCSCVSEEEYDVPPVGGEEPEIVVNSSIEAAQSAFNQNFYATGESVYTFPIPENDIEGTYLEAYVVSSDYGGNFYKSLVIQDHSENPEYGIEILIDKTSLFERFEVGRKVYVLLDGLSITYEDGEDNYPIGYIPPGSNDPDDHPGRYILGALKGNQVEEISAFLYEDFILRSLEIASIIPKEISINEFNEKNLNQFIQLQEMQFTVTELGKTYAGEPEDEFDGMRSLVSCTTNATSTLQTSTFADFKSYTVAEGRGTLNALLAKDFFGDQFVLIINNPTDLDFSDSNRCDPLFIESFDEAINDRNLEIEGWTNIAEEGSKVWTEGVFGSNGYAEFSAFQSGNTLDIGWMISPGIDLDTQNGESLYFQTAHAYPDAGHDPLEVFISINWDGTEAGIATATWDALEFTSSIEADYSAWFEFTDSGAIDLSAYSGTAHIAFKYTGSDTSNQNTTIQIDNVVVTIQ